ncbi:MAG: hypothetical protein ACT4O0_09190 [Pseudonocardia sp.]
MSMPRAPRIAGVAGGVGTTTLATALRGYDRSTDAGRGVDVLVCRATGQSLHRAATTVSRLVANGLPRPVLVVCGDQPGSVRGTPRARLRMIEPQMAALVVLPYVGHWRELTDPLAEAAQLAETAADQLPKQLRAYGDALAALTGSLLRSGLLHPARGAHPLHNAPTMPVVAVPSRTMPSRTVIPDLGRALLDLPLGRVAAHGAAR